jgi:hypothetical protein
METTVIAKVAAENVQNLINVRKTIADINHKTDKEIEEMTAKHSLISTWDYDDELPSENPEADALRAAIDNKKTDLKIYRALWEEIESALSRADALLNLVSLAYGV